MRNVVHDDCVYSWHFSRQFHYASEERGITRKSYRWRIRNMLSFSTYRIKKKNKILCWICDSIILLWIQYIPVNAFRFLFFSHHSYVALVRLLCKKNSAGFILYEPIIWYGVRSSLVYGIPEYIHSIYRINMCHTYTHSLNPLCQWKQIEI